MKALIFNGSLSGHNDLDPIQETLREELYSLGWEVEALPLCSMNIKACIGCFRCWHTTPGVA
jgi:multimeric flavodoxin WrbA